MDANSDIMMVGVTSMQHERYGKARIRPELVETQK